MITHSLQNQNSRVLPVNLGSVGSRSKHPVQSMFKTIGNRLSRLAVAKKLPSRLQKEICYFDAKATRR